MSGDRYRATGSIVSVDANQVAAIAEELAATEKEIELAMKRAINRTVQWMQTRARRAMAKGLNIPSKVIRARLRYSLYNTAKKSARVWFGLNPVSLARLKPRKTKQGVTAGGELYEGAFLGKGKSGNTHVYKRVGKSRFPIVSVYKDIESGASLLEREVFEGWDAFFYERFEHELKWQSRTV